jgi:hypothetical protein
VPAERLHKLIYGAIGGGLAHRGEQRREGGEVLGRVLGREDEAAERGDVEKDLNDGVQTKVVGC